MRKLFGLLGIAVVLSACNGRGTDDADTFQLVSTSGPVSFQKVNTEIFTPLCAKCHSTWFGSEHQLLSVDGLVQSGKPDNSLILQKIEDGEMPKGGTKLSDAQIDLVRRYIQGVDSAPRAPTVANFDNLNSQIFQPLCSECHAPWFKNEAQLLSYQDLVLPGDANASVLLERLETGSMPKTTTGKPDKLSDSQLDLVKRYINGIQGAPAKPTIEDVPETEATYSWLSANLTGVSCMPCHSSQDADPSKNKFALDTYADLQLHAQEAFSEIDTGMMPPHSSPKPGQPAHKPIPPATPEARAALADWIKLGYPQ